MGAENPDMSAGGQLGLPFEPLFSIRQAATASGINYWLLLRAVNNGDIPAYRFGNAKRRVRLSDIEAVVQASRG